MEAKFSLFETYQSKQPFAAIRLEQLQDFTSHPTSHAKKIFEAIQADPTRKSELKATAPCFTPGGLFLDRHTNIDFGFHLQIDIDQKDNTQISNWPDVRDWLAEWKHTSFAAISLSGVGCYALVKVATIDLKGHLMAMLPLFEKAGLTVDETKGKNLNDLRFISYDPAARMNLNAEPFTKIAAEPAPAPTMFRKPTTTGSGTSLIDSFNENCDVVALLQANGWKVAYKQGEHIRFTRPGKDGGISADWHTGRRLFYNFSDSTVIEATQNNGNHAISPFEIYRQLNNYTLESAIQSLK